jgi:hypothetical protein
MALVSSPNKVSAQILRDSTVEKIGTIKVDFSKSLKEQRGKYKKAQMAFPDELGFPVDISMTMSSAKGVLEAEAKEGRRKSGETTIEFVDDSEWRKGLVDAEDEEESSNEGDEDEDEDGEEAEDEDE